ncbi:carboxypeptidase regulatory-like domain-containing protein [Gynuella sunshinyii]|uniref:Protocatechuate 3,4-dioxygenase beta subunit n=1 Tax=Gynuella sunshinyii YC6258 TaxID=1445510 RepID=A0A0C5V6C9_9GAMM|nr:carboxypeptidase regulatory-like domain-containing protein [Gynuella sunshinyii]AJQ95015.1 protocatechuate 3,4-dioxygenase beta subunit [Gynuella sunshinyii YC6258]
MRYFSCITALLTVSCYLILQSAYSDAAPPLIPDFSSGKLLKNNPMNIESHMAIDRIRKDTDQELKNNPAQLLNQISQSAESTDPLMYTINLGYQYSDVLTADAPEHWYLFSSAEAGKVTVFASNIPEAVTYKVYLFSKPFGASASEYISEGASTTIRAAHQQISAISSDKRDYIMVVTADNAVSNESFSIGTVFSTQYDANEPNDSFSQATGVEAMSDITATLDNDYDIDIFKFTQPTQKNVVISITGGDYNAVLFNENGQNLYDKPFESGQSYAQTLPAGNYYWEVYSPSNNVIASEPYTLSTTEYLAQLSLQMETDQYGGHWLDYGDGQYFAIYQSAYVKGRAINKDGKPLAGAKLQFTLSNGITNLPDQVSYTTTDENGYYRVKAISPAGYGRKHFYGPVMTYYYDLFSLQVAVLYGSGQYKVPSLLVQEVRNSKVSAEYTTTRSGFTYYDIYIMKYHG